MLAEAVQVSVPTDAWHGGEWAVAALFGVPLAVALLLAGLCSYERHRAPVLGLGLAVLLVVAVPRL